MTVSTKEPKTETTVTIEGVLIYPYDFKIYVAADMAVYDKNPAIGNVVKLTNGIDFTVTSITDTGGNLLFAVAPVVTHELTFVSEIAYGQPTAIQEGTAFPSATVENMIDRTVRMAQQIEEKMERAIVVQQGDDLGGEIPVAAARANKVLAFDNVGAPSVSTNVLGTTRGNWATTTLYQVNDVIRSIDLATQGNIYAAAVSHTAGTFATDLAAGKWILIIDVSRWPTDNILYGDAIIDGSGNYSTTISNWDSNKTNQLILIRVNAANTTTNPTLTVNAGTAYPITTSSTEEIYVADLIPDQWLILTWHASGYFFLINPAQPHGLVDPLPWGVATSADGKNYTTTIGDYVATSNQQLLMINFTSACTDTLPTLSINEGTPIAIRQINTPPEVFAPNINLNRWTPLYYSPSAGYFEIVSLYHNLQESYSADFAIKHLGYDLKMQVGYQSINLNGLTDITFPEAYANTVIAVVPGVIMAATDFPNICIRSQSTTGFTVHNESTITTYLTWIAIGY